MSVSELLDTESKFMNEMVERFSVDNTHNQVKVSVSITAANVVITLS